jgi:hypothetical protein
MRKLILIAVLVLAGLVAGIAYVVASDDDDGERRAGALATGYSAGRIALQLDGAVVGFLHSVDCGEVSADVQRDAIVEGTKLVGDPKHIGRRGTSRARCRSTGATSTRLSRVGSRRL